MHRSFNFSTSLSTLVIVCLLMLAIWVGVKWYLIVVLIGIFIMTNEIEHFLVYSLAIFPVSLVTTHTFIIPQSSILSFLWKSGTKHGYTGPIFSLMKLSSKETQGQGHYYWFWTTEITKFDSIQAKRLLLSALVAFVFELLEYYTLTDYKAWNLLETVS